VSLQLGIGMIIAGLTAPLMILVAPFLGVMGPQLATFAATMAVCGEILFWAGVALAGRDTWRTIRSHGWRQTPRRMLEVVRAS
jgi:hypothetical protein